MQSRPGRLQTETLSWKYFEPTPSSETCEVFPQKSEIAPGKQFVCSPKTHAHPSLRAKKIKGSQEIWEASVSMSYRMTYQLEGDRLTLRRIGTHDILKKEAG
jgi:hypothetical protein